MKFEYNLEQRKVYTYLEYVADIESQVKHGTTSGADPTASRIQYTVLNKARMKRLDKRAALFPELVQKLRNLPPMTWYVITESWCGDSAQNMPWINAMAKENLGIALRMIYRDENEDIMDDFLTNGGRAIPKLIGVDQDGDVAFTWGPRPQSIQDDYMAWKAAGMDGHEAQHRLQKLYTEDHGDSIQADFLAAFDNLTPIYV